MAYEGWRRRKTTARIGGHLFHAVISPAAPYVAAMERQDGFDHTALAAVYALKSDPGCIEAHLFLADHCRDPDDERAHLAKAVETGERLWGPVAAAEDDFSWWGVHATRPYMRAVKRLADWHAGNDDPDEAERGYRRLLAMNPDDNQGIRYIVQEHEAPAHAM